MYPRPRRRPQPARVDRSPLSDQQKVRRHRPDYWLVALCALLLSIGLVVVYAISPALSESTNVGSNYYATKQLVAIGLSVIAFLITSRIPLGTWHALRKPLLIAAAIATFIALIMPINPHYPAHRWVRLGTFSFQSVELVKFALLIWLSGFLAMRMRADKVGEGAGDIFKPLLIFLGVMGVIVAGVQSDLGSAAVIVAMMCAMAFVAGLPMKRIALIGGVVLIGVTIAVASTPYRRARLETFMNPTAHCQTTGYQACQAMIAVGSGGLIGLGLGSSVQAYGYLPEAANDSIFAIYAEKFGFIGSALLLALFAALFSRIASIAERAPDNFSRLIASGVLGWLGVQAMINIGAMIGMFPLKGITLPFISYGGTSVVFAAAAIGLVFQISHYTSLSSEKQVSRTKGGVGYDHRRNGRRVGGAYHPDSGSRV